MNADKNMKFETSNSWSASLSNNLGSNGFLDDLSGGGLLLADKVSNPNKAVDLLNILDIDLFNVLSGVLILAASSHCGLIAFSLNFILEETEEMVKARVGEELFHSALGVLVEDFRNL